MSFFGRLFGSKPPSSPPPNTAVIADDLVAGLTAGGAPLDAAVDAALRRHLEADDARLVELFEEAQAVRERWAHR